MRYLPCVALGLTLACLAIADAVQAKPLVILMTDSYGDSGEYTTALNERGYQTVWSSGQSGATMYNEGDGCTVARGYPMGFWDGERGCNGVGEFQMLHEGGSCRSFQSIDEYPGRDSGDIDNSACGTTGSPATAAADDACCGDSDCVPTCWDDTPQIVPGSLCMMLFTVNDISTTPNTVWDGDEANFLAMMASLDTMLTQATARGVRCVFSTSFPNYESTRSFQWERQSFVVNHISEVVMPDHPEHVFLNFFDLVTQEHQRTGDFDSTIYTMYSINDSRPPYTHPGYTDSHLGVTGREWQAAIMADALDGLLMRSGE